MVESDLYRRFWRKQNTDPITRLNPLKETLSFGMWNACNISIDDLLFPDKSINPVG